MDQNSFWGSKKLRLSKKHVHILIFMFQIIVMNKKISKGQSFDPQILVSLWESAFLTKGALPHFF